MRAEGRRLSVVLLDRSCTDMMSGERLPLTATVRVDGREDPGCSRRLA
ncbi:MAG TPA: hypothetical protein VF212_01665 [Longimicrobiales bacterium]